MPGSPFPVVRQVSAGGVVYRHATSGVEVAIVRVGPKRRWQLPKGIVEEGEEPGATAVREVREEAGVNARVAAPLDTIEYWYVGNERDGRRVRFHKFVHLFLLEYSSGDVADHDHEVDEARWVSLSEAADMLAFESERNAISQAATLIGARGA